MYESVETLLRSGGVDMTEPELPGVLVMNVAPDES